MATLSCNDSHNLTAADHHVSKTFILNTSFKSVILSFK